jgi:hypothetical protein
VKTNIFSMRYKRGALTIDAMDDICVGLDPFLFYTQDVQDSMQIYWFHISVTLGNLEAPCATEQECRLEHVFVYVSIFKDPMNSELSVARCNEIVDS